MRRSVGILNSNVVNFFFRKRFSGNNHIASNQLAQIPIPYIEKSQHEKMVSLVTQMLELHKSKAGAKTQSEQDVFERQIRALDESIDSLVYELYGLSEEEIAIVEQR